VKEDFSVFVGIDWASREHQVCVLGPDRAVLFERRIAHDPKVLNELIDSLIEQAGGDTSRIAVAIEVPHGVVVETLLDRGLSVFALNPKQLDRFRDRYTTAGAKDDRRDALVLADALRTDRHAFARVSVGSPHIIELREEGRIHEELREQFVQAANRLGAQLQRFYPQLLTVADTTEPWMWALLEVAPTPAAARRLRRARVEKLLRSHRIRRLDAAHVLEALRAPAFQVAAGSAEAASRHIGVLLEQLRLLHRQRQHCQGRMEALLERCIEDRPEPSSISGTPRPEYSDAEILLSLPGVGTVVGTSLLSEAGAPLTERKLDMLRAVCGAAPVGVLAASDRLMTFLRCATTNGRRRAWALKLDIASFFPTIDKQTLYAIIARRASDPELRWLTRTIAPRCDVPEVGGAVGPAHLASGVVHARGG